MKSERRARIIAAASTVVISNLSLFHEAQATSFTWSTTPTDANMSGTNANWNPSADPTTATGSTPNNTVVFGATSATGQTPSINVGSVQYQALTFNADAPSYTFSGGTLILGTGTPSFGTLTNNSSNTQTFNCPIAFRVGTINLAAGDIVFGSTFNIGNNPNNNAGRNVTIVGSHNLTLNGAINGTTGTSTAPPTDTTNFGQLVMNGTGILTLADSPGTTYTGRMVLNGGVTRATTANAFGANGTVTVNGSVTFLSGTTHIGGGANTGRLELSGNVTFAPETLVLEGRSVSDTHLLNVSGSNTWTGAVQIDVGASPGTYSIQSDSGQLTIAGNINPITLNGNRNLVIRGAGNGLISGNVTAGTTTTLGIIKDGAGMWTLSGSNSYVGPTSVNAGTLQIGAGGSTGILGPASVTINGGTLVFNRGDNAIVPNAIGGTTGALIQAANSTLTLTGNLSYGGPTIVQAGTIALSTAKTGGGAFVVGDNAALSLSSASPTTTLAMSNLTVGGASGATLGFALGAAGNPTVPLIDAGGLTRNGAITVNVTGSNVSVGTVTLIQYAGAEGGTGSFALGPSRILGSLFDTGSKLDLNITGFDFPKWTGLLDATWNTAAGANPKNWVLNAGAVATDYLEGDAVLFDNSTANNTVSITATVSPSAVSVNNSSAHDYLFIGGGKITGLASLTKTGNGTLTIANDGINDFSGAISIGAGGTLQIGAGTTSGSIGGGALTNNGVLVFNRSDGAIVTNVVSGPGAIQINAGSVAFGIGGIVGNLGGGNVSVAGGATLAINRSDLVSAPNVISGSGNLVKQGSGTLVLSGDNSFEGAVTLTQGVIRAAANNAFGVGNKQIVVDTRTKGIDLDGGVTIPSSITFSLSNDGDTGQGATVLQALHSVTGLNTVNGNIQLQAGGGSSIVRVDAGGTLVLNGNINILGNAGARTLLLGGAGSGTINGSISNGTGSLDTLSIQLLGNLLPSWTFTNGSNSYTGFHSINSGTLTATASGALGTGTVFIGNGNGGSLSSIVGAVNIGADGVTLSNLLWTNKDGAATPQPNLRSIGITVPGTGTFTNEVHLNGGAVFRTVPGSTLVFTGLVRDGTDVSTGVNRNVLIPGPGTVIFSGNATYTGSTGIDAGTLVVGNGAQAPLLAGPGFTDLRGGRIVFNYNGGSDPLPTILPLLQTSLAGNFLTGQLRVSNATTGIGIGYLDDTGGKRLQLVRTYLGDGNCDGIVNGLDFNAVASSFGTIGGAVWDHGDFNYDGQVNSLDFDAVAANFNQVLVPAPAPGVALGALVPEPSLLMILPSASLLLRRRARGSDTHREQARGLREEAR